MTRIKSNAYYVLIYTTALIAGTVVLTLLLNYGNTRIYLGGGIVAAIAASVTSAQFLSNEGRNPQKSESRKLVNFSFLITAAVNIIITVLSFFTTILKIVFVSSIAGESFIYSMQLPVPLPIVLLIYAALLYWILYGIYHLNGKPKEDTQVVQNDSSLIPAESKNAQKPEPLNLPSARAISDDTPSTLAGTKTSIKTEALTTENNWQAPHEREGFAIQEERAPWGRWIVGLLFLALVIAGALWLASKVVVPKDLPAIEKVQDEPEEKAPKIGADAAAWVKALEKDTLEGYREYLSAFPKGKHAADAQAEIDAYDNKAWATAEKRNTLSGYEDYLEAWPEGLHASKARERIAEIKAEAEARAKDAAERAALDKTHWEAAARENTIESYSRYLTQQPTGQFVTEAQKRIEQLKADQANAAARAADTAAWEAAKTANRVDSYQQYMTSYPQGAFVPQALAAIEQLRPAVGRTFRDCNTCPEMVSLPSGTASLGAGDNEKDARPNEKPQRPVTFADMFAIGVKEVTFAEYNACVTAGGCTGQPRDNGWGGGTRPVINVSWDDALKYTSWLSQKTGKSYALPTEAQWEYAARAGDSNPIVGGSLAALCAFANGASQESGLKWANSACTDPAVDRTLPTGMLGANKFGVKDMIGNVAEWTQDCNTLNLRDAPTDGSADSRGSCNQRVVRGGSWLSGPADLRYAARLMQRRGDSNDFTGFRVIRKTGP